MNAQWVRQWVVALGQSEVRSRELQQRFGGELRPQPPNQAELSWKTGEAERAELVLAADHDPEAPVVRATLILRAQTGLTLGALAEEFGRWEAVPEDREKPAPAELISFGWLPGAAQGVQVLLRARVARPPGSVSRVRSVILVRSAPAAR